MRGKHPNKGWRITPSQEIAVDDLERAAKHRVACIPQQPRTKFASPKAIEVMRLYCTNFGSAHDIAGAVGCHVNFVWRIIQHWEKENPHLIANIKKILDAKRNLAC